MVQYAEIKEVETLIKNLNKDNTIKFNYPEVIHFLIKYKNILEDWYSDEQYHNKVEENIEL